MTTEISAATALQRTDPAVARLTEDEARRQRESIRLIASENYASRAVLEASGSVLTNKYSEGYPGRRYYEGQRYVDQIEELAIERARQVFGVDHANVQPYSGSVANLAVYMAFAEPGHARGDGHVHRGARAGDRQGRLPRPAGWPARPHDRRHRGRPRGGVAAGVLRLR